MNEEIFSLFVYGARDRERKRKRQSKLERLLITLNGSVARRLLLAIAIVFSVAPRIVIASDDATTNKPGYPDGWFAGDKGTRAKLAKYVGKPMPPLDGAEQFVPPEAGVQLTTNRTSVIVFWVTVNDEAVDALKNLEQIYQRYKDKKFCMLAICTNYPQDNYQTVAKQQGITFPIARDPDYKAMRAWHAAIWPTIAVVDKDGKVRAMGLKQEHVEDVVVDLMKEAKQLPDDYSPPKPAMQSIDRKWLEGSDAQRARLVAIEGKPAPELDVKDWVDEKLDASMTKGKIVVLDFWNPSNGVSVAAIAKNNALAKKYQSRGVVFIAIATSKAAANVASVAAARKISYPCCVDNNGATEKAFLVDDYDDYFIIDKTGDLRVADCANASVDVAIQSIVDASQ